MFKRKGHAKLSSGPEYVNSLDGDTLNLLTKYDLDARLLAKDSSTNRSTSKVSTTIEKNSIDDFTTTLRGSPHVFTTLHSSRSHIGEDTSLPPILSQHSSPKVKRGYYLSQNLRGYHGSMSVPSLVINEELIYEKLKMNMEEDYTSGLFLKRFKRLFPKQHGDKDVITVSKKGIKKSYSIKRARQIVDYLVEELRSLVKPKFSSALTRKSTTLDEQYNMVDDLDSAVVDMLKLCDQAMIQVRNKNNLDKILKEMQEIAHQTSNLELILYCIYFRAKVAVSRSEMKEAIFLFRQYKTLCVSYKLFKNKLSGYKNLGKCYQFIRKHRTALTYFTKFLQMAWHLDSSKHELIAYDFIGKQYYYLGIKDKAIYFHEKMSMAKFEPKTSAWRQIGVYKITLDQKSEYHSSRLTSQVGNNIENDTVEFGENRDDEKDDSVEMTSREEAVEIVIPPENKKPKVDESKKSPSEQKKDKAAKKMDKFINGIMKAQIIKNQESKPLGKQQLRARNNALSLKTEPDFERPTEVKVVLKSPTRPDANPNEKITISHLSRNRNMYNFSLLVGKDFDHLEIQGKESQITIGSMSADKVRQTIEKFRINLVLIKQSLEICNSGSETSKMFPILSRRVTEY